MSTPTIEFLDYEMRNPRGEVSTTQFPADASRWLSSQGTTDSPRRPSLAITVRGCRRCLPCGVKTNPMIDSMHPTQ